MDLNSNLSARVISDRRAGKAKATAIIAYLGGNTVQMIKFPLLKYIRRIES
jgi:hypothetical protein